MLEMIVPTMSVIALYLAILGGQLWRFQVSGAVGSAVTLADVVVFLVVVVWGIKTLAGKTRSKSETKPGWSWVLPDKAMLAFQLLLIATFALNVGSFSIGELKVGAAYLARLVTYLSLYWVARSWPVSDQFRATTYRWLIWVGVALAVSGFAQLAFFPDFGPLLSLGWDPHIGRLASSFLDPNYVGTFIGAALALASTQLFFGDTRHRRIYLILSVVLFVALYLTYSRSAWVSTALAVSFVGYRHHWRTGLLLLVLFTGVLFLPGRFSDRFSDAVTQTTINSSGVLDSGDDTSRARILSWQKGWAVVKSAPVFGVGYNNYGAASVREGVRREKDLLGHSGQGSDSSLLNTWATTGVLGLAALLVFLWSVFAAGLKMKRPDIEGASLLYFGFTAAFIAILIDSFLINSLYYAPLLIVWVVFAGLFAGRQAHRQ